MIRINCEHCDHQSHSVLEWLHHLIVVHPLAEYKIPPVPSSLVNHNPLLIKGLQSFESDLLHWLDYHIQLQHTKIDIAQQQSVDEIKFRAEGFLEALYCVRDFINHSEDK